MVRKGHGRQYVVTEVERGELDDRQEYYEVRWVVCEPVWVVLAGHEESEPGRQEIVPGVNAVAAWRVEREAARRLTVVERQRSRWRPE